MNDSATPFDRFRYFWWTLAIFATFGLAALLFAWLSGEKSEINSQDDERRLALRKEVDAEQAKLFPSFQPEDAFEVVGQQILAAKPTPVQAPAAPEAPAAAEADLAADSVESTPAVEEN